MDLNALSPYIRMAWDCTVSFPIKEIPRRIIYDYELIYIKEGSGSIEIEDRQYFFRPGDLYFLRPNVPHWIKLDEAGFLRQPHIHFDLIYRQDSPRIPVSFKQYSEMTSEEKKMIREDICREPPLDLPEKIVLHNQDHFEELLFDVIDEFQTKGALYEITVKLKFLRLWAYLLNEHRQNSSPPFPAGAREMERVKDYIHLHVKDPLTLDELASRFNISKYHLSRVFKSIYALPPVHYHQKLRMEKIREMILYTNISLTDIAEEFGYKSVNVFSRAFRCSEGISPSSLRSPFGAPTEKKR